MKILQAWKEDAEFHYRSRHPRALVFRMLLNPSLVASLLMRVACGERRILRFCARWLLISQFSCDVAPGAAILGPNDLPHPLGIVVGRGVVIGSRVRIYQNVTLGSSRDGSYPVVEDDVVLYTNAVVAGSITVRRGSTVGANVLLIRSTVAGETIRLP